MLADEERQSSLVVEFSKPPSSPPAAHLGDLDDEDAILMRRILDEIAVEKEVGPVEEDILGINSRLAQLKAFKPLSSSFSQDANSQIGDLGDAPEVSELDVFKLTRERDVRNSDSDDDTESSRDTEDSASE